MDMEKLYDKLMNDKEIKDIPIKYVFKVMIRIIEIINSGECYYDNREWS